MADERASYSVIVPVRNEATILRRTLPLLLSATEGDDAEIIYVCNGCTDASAAVIREIGGARVQLIETSAFGKAIAFNFGDESTDRFPRFYIDADIEVGPGCLSTLADILARGEADLVSPALTFDETEATCAARAIGRIWLSLPHGAAATFQAVIGLSRRAREQWCEFPEVIGDDIFIRAKVEPLPRLIVAELKATTPLPRSFPQWVRTRARWLAGERQLARMGLAVSRATDQRKRLLRLLFTPNTSLAAAAFILARGLAWPISLINSTNGSTWSPIRTGKAKRSLR